VVTATNVTVNSFTLSWQANTGATSYTYTQGGNPIVANSETSTSATFTGRTAGTLYSNLVVIARNDGGPVSSLPISVTTPVGDPTNLVASSISSSRFTLTWTIGLGANNNTVTLTGGPAASSSYSGAPTTVTFTGLSANTPYTVRVTSNIQGIISNPVTLVVTTTTPVIPVSYSSAYTPGQTYSLLPSGYTVPLGYTQMAVDILAGSGGGGGGGGGLGAGGR
jgi:hypothetical protein